MCAWSERNNDNKEGENMKNSRRETQLKPAKEKKMCKDQTNMTKSEEQLIN